MRSSLPARPAAVATALALCVSLTIGAATGAAGAGSGSGYVTDADSVYGIDTNTMTLSRLGALARPLVALTLGTDSELYGIDDGDQSLQRVNRTTGAETTQGQLLGTADHGRIFASLTALPGGKLYTSSYDIDGPSLDGQLYVVNPATGAASARGQRQTDDALLSLAGGCSGTLFGANDLNELVTVAPSTGVASPVGQLRPWPTGAEGVALAFDHADGTLWALVYQNGDAAERFYRVDPGTGTLTATSFIGQPGSDPSTLALDSPAQCRYSRTVSLTHPADTSRFQGVVRAKQRPACAASQRVRLLRQRPGADSQVGSALTDGQGRYRIAAPPNRGKFYAVAAKRSGADGVCLAAQSRTLSFAP